MKWILISVLAIMLIGCGLDPVKPVVVENRYQPIPVFHPPLPDGLSLNTVTWQVWTPKLMEEYIKNLKAGKAPVVVFYGLTPKGYEALAGNISEFKRYIKGEQSIILYYRKNLKKTLAPVEPIKESGKASEKNK